HCLDDRLDAGGEVELGAHAGVEGVESRRLARVELTAEGAVGPAADEGRRTGRVFRPATGGGEDRRERVAAPDRRGRQRLRRLQVLLVHERPGDRRVGVGVEVPGLTGVDLLLGDELGGGLGVVRIDPQVVDHVVVLDARDPAHRRAADLDGAAVGRLREEGQARGLRLNDPAAGAVTAGAVAAAGTAAAGTAAAAAAAAGSVAAALVAAGAAGAAALGGGL